MKTRAMIRSQELRKTEDTIDTMIYFLVNSLPEWKYVSACKTAYKTCQARRRAFDNRK